MHSRRRIPAASAQTICRFQPVRLSVWPFNRLVSTEARDCVMSGSLSQSEYLRDFDQEMCPINLRLVWNLNRQIVQRSDPGHAAAHGNGPGIPDQMPFIGQTTRDARDLIRSTAARYSERAWLAPVRLRVIAQVVEIYVSWAAQEDPHPIQIANGQIQIANGQIQIANSTRNPEAPSWGFRNPCRWATPSSTAVRAPPTSRRCMTNGPANVRHCLVGRGGDGDTAKARTSGVKRGPDRRVRCPCDALPRQISVAVPESECRCHGLHGPRRVQRLGGRAVSEEGRASFGTVRDPPSGTQPIANGQIQIIANSPRNPEAPKASLPGMSWRCNSAQIRSETIIFIPVWAAPATVMTSASGRSP
jgi:hypothetical protein